MKKITIIGASGQGKIVADIACLSGYDVIEFLDDNSEIHFCGNYPVVGNTSMDVDGDLFVAIGDNKIRQQMMLGRKVVSLIHPNAVIAKDVIIGSGTVIMAGVVINSSVTIGDGCIINTASSIDHDCLIGDFVHVSVGTHLCGSVSVGSNTFIGAGSTVVNNISICSNCIIGAGTVIIKDLNDSGTYVGVPAKRIK